jgi:proton glutamate symport protein
MKPATRALIGLLAGLVLGITASLIRSPALSSFISALEPLGNLWVNAIRMTAIPLVVALLIHTIASRADSRALGLTGARAVILFVFFLSALAALMIFIGPALFGRWSIGANTLAALRTTAASTAGATEQTVRSLPSFKDWLVALIPANPFKAAADGAMLPLVVFSILFALAVRKTSEPHKGLLVGLARAVSEAMLVLVGVVIALTPIGVFALIAPIGMNLGVGAAGAIGYYVVVLSAVFLLGILLLYPVAMWLGGIPLRTLVAGLLPAQLVAFTTRSSLASLPALLAGAESKLRLPQEVSSFALPLGVSTFKLNTPISWVAGAVFVGHLYGIPLTPLDIATVALAAVALSFSAPGIPSGGLFMLAPIFQSIGLPVAGVGIVIALDIIPDMFKTTFNVTADMCVALALSKQDRSERANEKVSPRSRPLVASLIGAALTILPVGAFGQTFAKDSVAFVKIPTVLLLPDMALRSDNKSRSKLGTMVDVVNGSVSVGGTPEWQTSGFAFMLRTTVSSIKTDKRTETTKVELKGNSEFPIIRIEIHGDVNTALAAVLARASDVEEARRQGYKALAARHLGGTLAQLSDAARQSLLSFADTTANGMTIGTATFKDNLYVAIDLGIDPVIHNDVRLTQGQRLASTINGRLLRVLKEFAAAAASVPQIYGLKLQYLSAHKDFLEEMAAPQFDKIELYAASEFIKSFAEADITSQQLADSSVILLNGNRISVQLAR